MAQSTSSQQYQTVLQSWNILVRRLSSAEAETGLLRQFYMKQWLDTTDKTNTDGMIRLALNKIEADVKNYGVFIEMLSAVKPLKDIVENMTSMYWACIIHLIMTNDLYDIYLCRDMSSCFF